MFKKMINVKYQLPTMSLLNCLICMHFCMYMFAFCCTWAHVFTCLNACSREYTCYSVCIMCMRARVYYLHVYSKCESHYIYVTTLLYASLFIWECTWTWLLEQMRWAVCVWKLREQFISCLNINNLQKRFGN